MSKCVCFSSDIIDELSNRDSLEKVLTAHKSTHYDYIIPHDP